MMIKLLLKLNKQHFASTTIGRLVVNYFVPIIIGGLVGVLIIFPLNEFICTMEYRPENMPAFEYILVVLKRCFSGEAPLKTISYAVLGALLGLIIILVYRTMQKRSLQIENLSAELAKDVGSLILKGESGLLEFKSSFRWDYKEGKMNRSLELPILKTLAGFMNSTGGTLLIGIDDNGKVLGLDNDYTTFKKQNRDGFEQAIVTAASKKLGTQSCRLIDTVFHSVENRDICRIIIKSSARPVFMKSDGKSKFYLRTGVSTREMDVQEAVEFIEDRWRK